MNYLIGLFLAAGIMLFSISKTADDQAIYWSALSFLIVVGGTVASGIISFSLKEMLRLIVILRVSFRTDKFGDTLNGIEEIVDISKAGTSPGILEKQIGKVRNLFLKDALQMIIDGVPREKIGEILQTRIEEKIEKEKSEANIIRTLSKYPTAFGMLGTIIGLVALLQGIGDTTGAANIGSNMAVALITTLYGIVVSYFILVPIADNLENKTYHNVQTQKMIMNGIDLVLTNETPLIVRETLLSYVSPSQREKLQ